MRWGSDLRAPSVFPLAIRRAGLEPKIAREWHPTKNGSLTHHDVTRGASRRIFWRCQFGHEWHATVNARTNKGTGCPRCARRRKQAAVMTGMRRRSVLLAEYEGPRYGPVRRVR